MRHKLHNKLKQGLWRAMALVAVLALSLPTAPAMGHETHNCAAPVDADLQQEHAGHHFVANADACTADAALPDHNTDCCGDQCDACVCTACPAAFLIPESKRAITTSVPDAPTAPVAAAFDDFAADVPRAPPKPRS